MIIVMAVFVLLCLYKIKFSHFHADYMEPGQTGAIKGIFAVIILFSHARSYLDITSLADRLYIFPLDLLGQLMVTMFFFYSGYGIFEAFRRKQDYTRGFFRSRILKTLVHFDIAVVLYLIVALALGMSYPVKNYIFCWLGWHTIGNSNWFVCDMLLLYLITLPVMVLVKKRKWAQPLLCVITTVLTAVLWVVLWKAKGVIYGGAIWYNTLLCYPLGMWYGLCKGKLDGFFRRHKLLFWAVFAVLFAAFAPLYLRRGSIVLHTVCAVVFTLLFVMITVKVKLDNPILRWLGKHSFSIYILQRIPMILFDHWGWDGNHLVFLVISLVATLVISVVYDRFLDWLDPKLFAAKRGKGAA